ncbi:UDP-glycosyltransferase 76H1-like [Cynara cardunculus var. scolymus]|uniref:UDP-glycosyltransferase 76H1-like n=1 Tax=Cynara cardunculus var. scolymus TaxID=59895 RepID=UPI000D623CA0|nr:UDP-glycosyltransferase 76H1-like [Cynara cardunculus var. scolymus]
MEEDGGRRWPLVVLTSSPFHGHMTPTLQLATALHALGFTIAIAHAQLNPPDPSNHPDFIFLPLSDNLSAIDASSSFTGFIQTLNTNCRPSLHQHLIRLMSEESRGDKSMVIIYDYLMFFAGAVAMDLNLTSIIFRSSSATYFPAFLVRRQLHQQARFLEQDFAMQDMVPDLHPLRYKDLPFSKSPIEDWHQLVAIFSQQRNPCAVIWNTVKFLEHEALSQIHQHYQVPVFAVGPLHKITPSPPTSFLEADTSCISWLDKQAPKSVIYVSFGSLVTLDVKVLAEMAWGLANSNQRFLWAVRPGSVSDAEWTEFFPEGFREETRERSLIVKWAPQKEVLAHSAVGGFWSHCGWNSTLESISEGVPMICQPFNVDQGVNARYVSYVWKIGVELEVLERGEMESMIRRVMVNEEGKEMRMRAGEMSEMVKDAVQNGGSSHESLEGLVDFIMSRSILSP